MLEQIIASLGQVLHPSSLGLITLGTVWGIFCGCIPGFTIAMAVALLLPFTFGMSPIHGLCTMLGAFVGGLTGGQISGILLGIPGTPASIATLFDGHPMAQKGFPGMALSLGIWASFLGGIISAFFLMFLTPPLAGVALKFGPWEFFSLVAFGLTVIASLSGKSFVKGCISGVLGLIAATVGTDPMTGVPRFNFGSHELMVGFPFLPVLIGLFAFSQLMKGLENKKKTSKGLVVNAKLSFSSVETIKTIFSKPFNLIRSTLIGIFVGVLPGAGGSIACLVSYDQAHKASRHPEKFGTGVPEGIVASEASNNATGGGALIPTLALGVPGDAIGAILLGALILHGIQPGPLLIVEYTELVYGIFFAFLVAHFIVLGVQLYGIKLFVKIITIPLYILIPSILVFCAVGSFSIHNRFFDVWVLFIFGIVGYGMAKAKYPLPPMILGVILGPMAESNFRRAIQTDADYSLFFTRPISLVFLILCAISILYPFLRMYKDKKKRQTTQSQ